jgi:hypothetical protein
VEANEEEKDKKIDPKQYKARWEKPSNPNSWITIAEDKKTRKGLLLACKH